MHAGGHRFEPVHLHQGSLTIAYDWKEKKKAKGKVHIAVKLLMVKLVRAYGGCLGIERR